ncbi:MAG TPA: maltose alpha-D-glucosyltransferase [Magnetospirillaceae bacterium]|jgi:maltose alpha-D-glucosyltransferase/alpha-amylase
MEGTSVRERPVIRARKKDSINRDEPLWYKDAVIYELHIKAMCDSNGDGIGDFVGLTSRLDYLHDLGVNTLWLLPFYPSPLRDDGYDISDYRGINPAYGTMRDFRNFIRAAHERGMRVITELVINHTSDQHPWFQRARRSKPGSTWRDFYVWSDTDQKFLGARTIFIDVEKSNWAWDPVAKAYYWHRFYSHQPDLNFDNPRVLKEVMSVLNYWLEMGVDGLRLDAIPYLVERDGTNSENLSETHDVLKKLRAEINEKFPDRILLAEANQWPEDVLPYFGEGDECHMAFHFPLMPRTFMAITQEDRYPITDILRQTPDIPENCQWALFVRNHDELTLEMVTAHERDALWQSYAADPRMRLNLGIRRRLAPLLDNDRRKIELMTGLLLALPGTPVLYYGDEIGMGDNVYLGDRDGVRTPMQWSSDRNGGFSRADPGRLYLPPIQDPIYGLGAVNVEAQSRSPSSLLNWTRRMLSIRQGQKVFGRGTMQFLYPGNRKILAFIRSYEEKTVLCIYNLSRAPQPVELDLSKYKGRVPIELSGRSTFPPVGELPYLMTLSSYGFHWFILADEVQLPSWHATLPDPAPEFVTLVCRHNWSEMFQGPARGTLESVAFPGFLALQRWFGGKHRHVASTHLARLVEMEDDGNTYYLGEIAVDFADGHDSETYFLPLTSTINDAPLAPGAPLISFTVAQARRGSNTASLFDAMVSRDFPFALLRAMAAGRRLTMDGGAIEFTAPKGVEALDLAGELEIKRAGGEQSNSSILIGDRFVLKIYRKLATGMHPEYEMCRYLTAQGFAYTPPLLGGMEQVDGKDRRMALGIVQGFVRNQGTGWDHALDFLRSQIDDVQVAAKPEPTEPKVESVHLAYTPLAARLGQHVAEMHATLARTTGDAAFDPEPVSEKDLAAWRKSAHRMVKDAFDVLSHVRKSLPADLQMQVNTLYQRRRECFQLIDRCTAEPIKSAKTRIHGDLHLGQVLLTGGDWQIIDFEGEPNRSLDERRAKTSVLRDVAGMVRSYDYVARAAISRLARVTGGHTDDAWKHSQAWRDETIAAFLTAYREAAAGSANHPTDDAEWKRLLDLFTFEKAFYELRYEASNRPTWIAVPLTGIVGLLDGMEGKF